ncbi:putative ATP-dependent RNA helicase DDX31, partial [Camelus dromedarius]
MCSFFWAHKRSEAKYPCVAGRQRCSCEIPDGLRLRDVNCFCASLKGKTLAYCIPVVQSLQAMESKIQRADGPYALILVPTRELALQSFETVQKLLKFERDQKMVVFFLSCELVEFHYNLFLQTLLGGSGAPALGRLPSASMQFGFLRLHGDMEQEYNAPASPAEYIHRIGRTARIGCRGSSLLILAPSEAEYVNSLASHKINVSEIKMEDILSVLTKDDCFKRRRRGNQKSHAVGPQEIRERATVLQTVFEDYVHSSERTVSGAKKALQSFIRAYAAYPRELKHIFHVRFLHLGHVAKSFGLRDAPKNLSALSVKKKKANLK